MLPFICRYIIITIYEVRFAPLTSNWGSRGSEINQDSDPLPLNFPEQKVYVWLSLQARQKILHSSLPVVETFWNGFTYGRWSVGFFLKRSWNSSRCNWRRWSGSWQKTVQRHWNRSNFFDKRQHERFSGKPEIRRRKTLGHCKNWRVLFNEKHRRRCNRQRKLRKFCGKFFQEGSENVLTCYPACYPISSFIFVESS